MRYHAETDEFEISPKQYALLKHLQEGARREEAGELEAGTVGAFGLWLHKVSHLHPQDSLNIKHVGLMKCKEVAELLGWLCPQLEQEEFYEE